MRRVDAILRRVLLLILVCTFVAAEAQAARVHVVKRGETLTSIAERYGVAVATLARANKLRDQDLLRRGQKLQIPASPATFVTHRVVRGDSLASIAKRYRCSIADLRAHNELTDPDRIIVGQTLRIPIAAGSGRPPTAGSATSSPAPTSGPRLPATVQTAIDGTVTRPGTWQHLVIHHSATNEGSGKGMDRYHREERHMENGLAYHFVIGNGRGMGDGEIYVGARWTKQLPGGHLAIEALNQISLGICLVGDFEKRAPTRKQLDSLEALLRALRQKTGVPLSAVTSHRRIHPNHTKCPGRHFPLEAFVERLKRP